MADRSLIEWTDTTWQPITGCSVISPGCTNCYAMKIAGTRLRDHRSRKGLTLQGKSGPVWNGKVRLNEEWLDQPLGWRKPRKIFVCAHGDLFHESVPDAWIDRVFAVMSLAPQHTFQVLTKRAARMREYFTQDGGYGRWGYIEHQARKLTGIPSDKTLAHMGGMNLPNVWLGVSVEDQERADQRIPELLATPAAVHFISAEPLLGPVGLKPQWVGRCCCEFQPDQGQVCCHDCPIQAGVKLDWVIVGGESGAGGRPMHPAWVRLLRDQCADAGVAFFFKQWGVWKPIAQWEPWSNKAQRAIDLNGDEVPDDVAPEALGGHRLKAIGKRCAGRELDGVTYSQFPEVA